MKPKYASVSDAVVAFLRAELERRYQYDNVCRFKDLKKIDPETVAHFRDFALRRVYPEGEARKVIDGAFTGLHEILRSPLKMASLGSVAMAAVWRLGRKLPVAISAGQQVIHTFSCASSVETSLCEVVLAHGIPWKSGLSPEQMRPVFAQLPESLSENLIAALVRLLELAGNHDTLQTGLGLLSKIDETMQRSPGQWSDNDRHGVTLAMDTIAEGIELFAGIDDRDVPRFVKGIKAVEEDWYRRLRSGH